MHAQSTDYAMNQETEIPYKFKESYQKKIYKVQKRSDHLRKSTMEINNQI